MAKRKITPEEHAATERQSWVHYFAYRAAIENRIEWIATVKDTDYPKNSYRIGVSSLDQHGAIMHIRFRAPGQSDTFTLADLDSYLDDFERHRGCGTIWHQIADEAILQARSMRREALEKKYAA